MRHRAETIVLLCGLSLLATACGGGPEGTADETTAPPAAEAAAGPSPGAAAPQTGPVGRGGEPWRPLPPVQELYEAVQRDPDDVRTRHLFAVALHRAGRRDEALEQFQKVVEQKPETPYLIELGVAYASLERMDESEATFQRALESAPGHPGALYHLGNLTRRRGNTTEAISLYRQAVQAKPEHLMAQFQLAESLRQAGQLEPAYRGYERVVSLDPKAPPELRAFDAALLQLASIDLQMGATERAVEFLEVLVGATPEHPTAHLLLGQALSKLGRQEEAKQQLAIHQRIATQQNAAQ